MNTQDMSITYLILNASWVVQVVMLILVVGSIASWATIFKKSSLLKDARKLNGEFEEDFWSGASLNDLYTAAVQNARTSGPLERMFANGMREFHKLRERQIHNANTLLDGSRRAMMASFNREMDALENGLSFLGTVGSISPYVGLFGTVWGIMHAFTGFASMEQISLATVAPGIAEALVATAMGLFTAIPAVIAYNRFSREVDRTAIRMETFGDEFTNILQRNLGATQSASGH
ncbi:protein TolQ [Lampropedia aestuarii]|uniref:Tol-Pal system protein TolQ n=1 Tax=Lampropedia aestuarii TaxID=2562762 RepID=A0A4S5BKZ0_9BURK|nr:protein TolQ [Lampropedia aestuarii]MDH5858846.1 protein TolQ [Lampropedia aestuarii]THJ33194.1 protein TolQ [Lampropedia aestuarii]